MVHVDKMNDIISKLGFLLLKIDFDYFFFAHGSLADRSPKKRVGHMSDRTPR